MNPDIPARTTTFEQQLLIALSSYLSAAEGRISFSVLKSSFPEAERGQLIAALAELEEQNVIRLSVRHNAVFEKATRITQSLKPLS